MPSDSVLGNKLSQPLNAPLPMFITLSGMEMLCSAVQPANAPPDSSYAVAPPMEMTPCGICISVMAVQFLKASAAMIEVLG